MSAATAAATPTAVEATNSRRDRTSDTRRSGRGACMGLRAGAAAVNLLRPRRDDTVPTVNPQDPPGPRAVVHAAKADALIARRAAQDPGAPQPKYVRPTVA